MNEPVTVSTLILVLYFFLYPESLAGIFYLALFLIYEAIKLFFLMLVSPVGMWVLLIGSYFLISHRAPVYIACAYGAVVLAMIIHEAITGTIKKSLNLKMNLPLKRSIQIRSFVWGHLLSWCGELGATSSGCLIL